MPKNNKQNVIVCPHCNKEFSFDETELQSVLSQVRDSQFEKELEKRADEIKKQAEDNYNLELEKARLLERETNEIATISLKDEITELKNRLSNTESDKRIALLEADKKASEILSDTKREYESKLSKVTTDIASQKDKYELLLEEEKKQTEFYKDLKTRMSTKMIGETLEQHCALSFEQIRGALPRTIEFDKDNDVSKTSGSKGDFIYREYDDTGLEVVSIMFEMKNEADTTATKHKNEDFFKELDKDRKEKNCEYAVLVTLLESDSDYYNAGIVDVSHKFEKMYVVRPQCFIPIITLLRNAAQNAMKYKQELAVVRSQNVDVTNFESNLIAFKDAFSRNYDLAHKHFNSAIDEIDKTIDHLQKVKESLLKSDRQYEIASNKVEDVTIKKLTKNAPSIAEAIKNNK